MDKTELKLLMDVVFDKELKDCFHKNTWAFIRAERTGDYVLSYLNADTLIEIFSTIQNTKELKSEFLQRLVDSVRESNEETSYNRERTYGIDVLCFCTLIQIGYVDEALKAFLERKKSSEFLVGLILDLLEHGHNFFDIEQLTKIKERTIDIRKVIGPGTQSRFWTTLFLLDQRIIDERYELLKNIIRGINVEINLDKKTVSEKIDYLGLDPKYKNLLDEIDNFITSDTTEFVNAAMISNLRVFLADLLKDVAKKIADSKEEIIPKIEGRGEMGNIRQYLKVNLRLSERDDKFINAFVDILHSEGGHSFTSTKEYFRLARNIAIEIALLVLSKYEKREIF